MLLFNSLLLRKKPTTPVEAVPLTITFVDGCAFDNVDISVRTIGKPDTTGLQYRYGTEGPWTEYNIGKNLNLSKRKPVVQFQNTNNFLSTDTSNYIRLYANPSTNSIKASGSMRSMVNWQKEIPAYSFYRFFYNTGIITAPLMDFEKVGEYGCYGMFEKCEKLLIPPELPAMELAMYAYHSMFLHCVRLLSTMSLPATTLAQYCYASMFEECTSLITAYPLTAKSLPDYAYDSMFKNCEALEVAPHIAATEINYESLAQMFWYCSSLRYISVEFTNWGNSGPATSQWVKFLSENGTFACPPELPENRGMHYIPDGWKRIDYVDPEAPPTINVEYYYNEAIENANQVKNNKDLVTLANLMLNEIIEGEK